MKHRIFALLIALVFVVGLMAGCTPTEPKEAGLDIETPELQPGAVGNGKPSGTNAGTNDAGADNSQGGADPAEAPGQNAGQSSASAENSSNGGNPENPGSSSGNPGSGNSGNAGTNPNGNSAGTNPGGNSGGTNPGGNSQSPDPDGDDVPFSLDPDELPLIQADPDDAPSDGTAAPDETTDTSESQPSDGGVELPIIPIG